ncbi:purine-cytosine permease family protein [Nocardia sp. NPDC058640]|uniref:purine-cytosine permease family protein n=1 Tax=Nocardia sp. NPDC058640 TaxID=3346571 RepID=UPI0036473384
MTIDLSKSRTGQEAPLLLSTEPPRTFGFTDQAAFWTNLGVSLIGFTGAIYVLQPAGYARLPLIGAILATVVGTLIGASMVAAAGAVGARTGAPAMANFRGLFGTKLSGLPTIANVVQCIGWGVYELTVIAAGIAALTDGRVPHAVVVIAAGALSTVMAIWPMHVVGILRKYVTVAVGIAMLYFTVQLVRQPLPDLGETSWSGFFPAVDTALAVAVSFVPLAADYMRHSKSAKVGSAAMFVGYSVAQIWCYLLGIVALLHVDGDPNRLFDSFLGITAGWVFFAVLVLRETDQSFANVYSTAMSLQNLLPRVDRRILAGVVGVIATVAALFVTDFSNYANFLLLIGSVFVPLTAVLVVDFFFGKGRTGWNLTDSSPARPIMLLPWVIGFVVYQLCNPGSVQWWASRWIQVQDAIGIHPTWWTSASLFSFVAAGVATGLVVVVSRRR